MAIVTTDDKHYQNISAKIREKAGNSSTYKPAEMPSGIDEVYEAGKQAGYDYLWDMLQQNGNRNNYTYFFGHGWTDELYNPKYDIICKNKNNNSIFVYARITDTKVTIDFSEGHGTYIFQGSTMIKTIRKLIVSENTTFVNWFYSMSNIENLTIEGTIGQNGFNIQWSTKLSHDSLMSIINALQDKSADTSGTEWIVTIGSGNIEKLTAEEVRIAHEKGWTLE